MNQRQGLRKGSLTTKGNPSLLSKVATPKKSSEVKKVASKIPSLPALNLSKVRRNLFDPAQLQPAAYATVRGIRTPGKEAQVSPRVHSARFTSEGAKAEKESLTRGSLTDRSCKETSVNLHGGSLRSRKECAAEHVAAPKLKLEIQTKQVFQQDCTKSNDREKICGKISAYSTHVSNLSSSGNVLSGCLTTRRQNTDASLKNSGLARKIFVNSVVENTADPRHKSGSLSQRMGNGLAESNIDLKDKSRCGSQKMVNAVPKSAADPIHKFGTVSQKMGHDLEAPRPRTAKVVDTLDWEVKKLSSHILNTLEETLTKVKKPSSDKKSSSTGLSSSDESSVGIGASRTRAVNRQMKHVSHSDKPRMKEIKQLSQLCENLGSSKRTGNTTAGDSGSGDPRERVGHDQSKNLTRVRPLKLSLDNNQTSVPLGFGGNPVENVQTSRVCHPTVAEPSPRMAFTERFVSRKSPAEDAKPELRKINVPSFPILSLGVSMNPKAVLRQYANQLTEYEQQEILSFNEIHFIGTSGQKHQASEALAACNYGYDDERGDYNIVEHDHLAYRYEVLGMLGKGSFGQVVKCHDHKFKVLRAVKMVRNRKRFHQQALIEVKILEYLRDKATEENGNYNIVTIFESFYFRGHLCICFALHDISLYELIKRNNFQGLNLIIIRSFATQLLTTLKFLRKLGVIHCDLKPENILLHHSSLSKIKVIDFGSSCFENERIYTYIQSRFYRSPEVILGLPYDMMIDVWSLGCILAELYTGYPLFAGENEVEQLACIMEVLGTPPSSVLEKATRKKMFFDSNDSPRIVPNSWGKKHWPGEKPIASTIMCNDPLFLNFLECCLCWDRNQRSTPDELLNHPWIRRDSSYMEGNPLQPSSCGTSKRSCMSEKVSDVSQMSVKLSKQNTSKTVKHHSACSAKKNSEFDISSVLPTIGEMTPFTKTPK